MIVAQCGDDVRADARFGERIGQSGGQSNRAQAGVHTEADPRPIAFRIGTDPGKTFILADQGEGVAQRLIGRCLECVALGTKARLQIAQKAQKIAFAFVGRDLAP